jgi:hypothetical protein
VDTATQRQHLKDEARITSTESLRVPLNFERTTKVYDPTNKDSDHGGRMAGPFDNHQTKTFAETFGLTLPTLTAAQDEAHSSAYCEVQPDFSNQHESNPDEIDLEEQFEDQ